MFIKLLNKKTHASEDARCKRLKVKQEAQSKSLKSIYLSLSKVLHPDKETDPVLKMEKEELTSKKMISDFIDDFHSDMLAFRYFDDFDDFDNF